MTCTQEAQGAEHPGRKLAPAHTTARAAYEGLQVSRPGAALPVRPRRDQQPLPAPPPPSVRRPVSRRSDQGFSGLGRGQRCCRVATGTLPLLRAVATSIQQVDSATQTVGGRPRHQRPRSRKSDGISWTSRSVCWTAMNCHHRGQPEPNQRQGRGLRHLAETTHHRSNELLAIEWRGEEAFGVARLRQ